MDFGSLPPYTDDPDERIVSAFRLGLRRHDFIVLVLVVSFALPLGVPVVRWQRDCLATFMRTSRDHENDTKIDLTTRSGLPRPWGQ